VSDPKDVDTIRLNVQLFNEYRFKTVPLNIESYLELSKIKSLIDIAFIDKLLLELGLSKSKIKKQSYKMLDEYFYSLMRQDQFKNETLLRSNSEILINYFVMQELYRILQDHQIISENNRLGVIIKPEITVNYLENGVIFDSTTFAADVLDHTSLIHLKQSNKKRITKVIKEKSEYLIENISYLVHQLGTAHGFNLYNFLKYLGTIRKLNGNVLLFLHAAEFERCVPYITIFNETTKKVTFCSLNDQPLSNIIKLFKKIYRIPFLEVSAYKKPFKIKQEIKIKEFFEKVWLHEVNVYLEDFKVSLIENKIGFLLLTSNRKFPSLQIEAIAQDLNIHTVMFPHSPNDEFVPWLQPDEFIVPSDNYQIALNSSKTSSTHFTESPLLKNMIYKPYRQEKIDFKLKPTLGKKKLLILIQQIDGGNRILDNDLGYFLEFLDRIVELTNSSENYEFIIKDHPRMPLNGLLEKQFPTLMDFLLKSSLDVTNIIEESDCVLSHIGIGSVAETVVNLKKELFIYVGSQSDFYLSKSFSIHNLISSSKTKKIHNLDLFE
jgi:hypothetical protein